MSWGAVSQFCNILLTSGIALEKKIPNNGIGKAPTQIRLNPGKYYLIGLDLTLNHVRGVLTNLRGDELLDRVIPVKEPGKAMSYLEKIVNDFFEYAEPEARFLAIGVAVPGDVDLENGRLRRSVFSEKWNDLDIRHILETWFQIPVYVYGDCECVLAAEKHLGLMAKENYEDAALVSLNYGIGMAYMHNSKTYYSFAAHQCEIGHITIQPGGTLCNCGKRGCLEMYASKLGIVRQFKEAVWKGAFTDVDISLSESALYNSIRLHARQGDSLCLRLFENAGRYMGKACASVCTLLEPEVLIIYGDLLGDGILWKDFFEVCFYEDLFPLCQTKVAYSFLNISAPMLGAALSAADVLLDSFLTGLISSCPPKL
ncbi:MAG: ROK family protein [Lachnospiraceae bacterium]|nr:ROK family protein [Lachnospiraceae bacterium]